MRSPLFLFIRVKETVNKLTSSCQASWPRNSFNLKFLKLSPDQWEKIFHIRLLFPFLEEKFWLSGHHQPGLYNDLDIFRLSLSTFVEPFEHVEADDGYAGEASLKVKCQVV